MTSQLFAKLKPYLGSLLAAVILLLAVLWGAGKGQSLAQAQAVLEASQQTQKALQYFYQDQNRFPTAVEFADQNIMLSYLSTFPLPNWPSKSCPHSFDYQWMSDTSYQLDFCLPAAINGYNSGWNVVNGVPNGMH